MNQWLGEDVAAWVYGSKQVVRGRCRSLGLRFEIGGSGKMSQVRSMVRTSSPGKMSHPGFMVRNRWLGEDVGPWVYGSKQVVRGRCHTPGLRSESVARGECHTLGLWFEQVDQGRCRTLGLRFEQVVRGRCQTLGLWFETGSPGRMSHPGFMVRNR